MMFGDQKRARALRLYEERPFRAFGPMQWQTIPAAGGCALNVDFNPLDFQQPQKAKSNDAKLAKGNVQ